VLSSDVCGIGLGDHTLGTAIRETETIAEGANRRVQRHRRDPSEVQLCVCGSVGRSPSVVIVRGRVPAASDFFVYTDEI